EGPLADDATSLTLLFNESRNREGGTVNDSTRPHFTLGPIDLTGERSAPSAGGESLDAVEVDLDLEQRTASGVVFRLDRLEVTDLEILADVVVIVPADRGKAYLNNQMAGKAVARDDLGNDYPLVAPEGNGSVAIDDGEQLDGSLVFQGPLVDGARTLTLLFNQDSDPEGTNQNDRMYPHFAFGPIDLTSGR
ncbi:MAG: hypothetical protein WD378_03880, partial [Egicoccus sp.]